VHKRASLWTLVALIAIIAYDALTIPGFLTIEIRNGNLFGSLIDIVHHAAPVAIIALGMTLVIATRGIDLSVGAVAAISGTIGALAVSKGQSATVAIALALSTATVLGSCNGMLVRFLGLQPIVATLILMVSGRGIAQLLSNGQIITFDDPTLGAFGTGHWLMLPLSLWITIGIAIIIYLITRRTALGLFIGATGDNPTAAKFAGVPVKTILLFVYALTGLCAGIAGLMIAGETKAADANNAGLYIELDAILAVVLGGTLLTGGRFQLVGSLIGALLIQALTTTILTKGVQVEWTLVVKAAIILAISLARALAGRATVARVRSRAA